jgi:hypothetical protein
MTSPFDWRAAPSETVAALKPSPKARQKPNKATPLYGLSHKADEILRARFGGAYSKAASKETPDAL